MIKLNDYYISIYFTKFFQIKLLFIFFLLIILSFLYNNNYFEAITELINTQTQKLNLLIPDEKCPYLSSSTLYFTSKYRDKSINNNDKTKKLILNNDYKKYFITYYLDYDSYNEYEQLLNQHGLIKSSFPYGNHNIFIRSFNPKNFNYFFKNFPINKYQKIFKYFDIEIILNKANLYQNYIFMKKLYKEEYNFMPETFVFPKDKKIIENKFRNYNLNIKDLWLIKPINQCCGKGIHIFLSLDKIEETKYIICKYINNPNLINKRKYDLRLYILISGLKPLRIYFYKEGLVRISTSIYSLNKKSFLNKFIHLTNTAINRKNKNYIYPKNVNDEKSNIWSLNIYKKYLNDHNINYYSIRNKIKDLIIKTIISFQQKLIDKYESLNLKDSNLYNVLGFDIMITENFEPLLIEVNKTPDMGRYNNLDKIIKTNLFVDTLNIVGIKPFSHIKGYKSLFKEHKFQNYIDESYNNAICELYRPRGDYELIFPLKENIKKYKKYFLNVSKENNKFWEKIMNT